MTGETISRKRKPLNCKGFIFDKNGTLVDLWSALYALARAREREITRVVGPQYAPAWRQAVGIGHEGRIDPQGPLATARRSDEIAVAAGAKLAIATTDNRRRTERAFRNLGVAAVLKACEPLGLKPADVAVVGATPADMLMSRAADIMLASAADLAAEGISYLSLVIGPDGGVSHCRTSPVVVSSRRYDL